MYICGDLVDKANDPAGPSQPVVEDYTSSPRLEENVARAFSIAVSAWVKRFPLEQPKVPTLSHYTTSEGLLGICTTDALWATCAQYSNDVSEVVYAQSLAKDVLQEVVGKQTAVSGAAGAQLKSLLEVGIDKASIADAYIVSFCEISDLLSQWRAYGRSAGFEVRFESLTKPNALLKVEVLALESPFVQRKVLTKVMYSKEEQQKQLKGLLEGTIEILNEAVHAHSELAAEIPGVLGMLVLSDFTQWLYSVKHPKFAEEQEWRVITFPELTRLFYGGEYKHPNHLKFRPGRHSLVPYIELTPTEGKLPISEVLCGPGGHHQLTAKAVELLMAATDHKGVKVGNSDVPLAY